VEGVEGPDDVEKKVHLGLEDGDLALRSATRV
jgi:hypothetical protein